MTKKPQADAGEPDNQRDETEAETIRDLTTRDEEAEGVTGGATSGDEFGNPQDPVPM